jgi:arylsulfatase A-like enzyme
VAKLKRLIGAIVGGAIVTFMTLMSAARGRKPNPAASGSAAPKASSLPNILLIAIDDLDVDTLDTMLEAGQLPNIKSKLIDGSANFRNAYVPCSICSPSRASLLTGKFSHNHGVWHVVGDEGPREFDDYLISTSGAYLPNWLGNSYYRAFVGKFHLRFRHPNWDFFRQVDGYDLRPGMYKANESGKEVWPAVYQTKYIGDVAKQAIAAAGSKSFFLVVAPSAAHVNISGWFERHNHAIGQYDGMPVDISQFPDDQTGGWRQHLVTVDFSTGAPVYSWWYRDSAQRDSGWGNWIKTGTAATIAPNTGNGAVVGWNVMKPSPNIRRQHLVRQLGQDLEFYSRDFIANEPAKPWTLDGDETVLTGTGTLPVAGWSVIVFPSGVIRQQVIRGSETSGYVSYVRHRVPTSVVFSPWRLDPDWGEIVVFGRLCGFTLIHVEGARYLIKLIVRRPGSSRFQWWQSGEYIDFQELAFSGSKSAVRSTAAPNVVREEGDLYLDPAMEYSPVTGYIYHDKDSDGGKGVDSLPDGQTTIVTEVHPYFLLRAYAEGSWWPVADGQTYNYGGNYPAGSLRLNRDPHGFEESSPQFDLPRSKPSFNAQLGNTIPFFSKTTWPDLANPVWGNKQQQNYLKRLTLDRMEQLISIDRMVGEVVTAAGPNTIIIFTSDNGHFSGEHRLSNKLTPHEESVRVPLYIRHPQGQQREITQMVANIDIAPTILDYAGQVWTAPDFNVDGRSLRQFVDSGTVANWRRSLLLEYHQPRGLSPGEPSPTDWRFGLPDYLALREIHRAGAASIDSLYVQYYNNVANPTTAFAYEYYLMDADPNQTNNLATGKIVALDNILRDFYTASGSESRQLDTAGSPVM